MSDSYTCKGYLDYLNNRIKVWREGKGFLTSWKNVGDKLLLVVSELTEAFEAYRDLTPETIEKLAADKPVLGKTEALRKQLGALANFNEELADTYIRLGDLCASLGIDIEQHIDQKMQVNEKRPKKHGRQR